MDLEPTDFQADLTYESAKEVKYWNIRFWTSALLTAPVLILAMLGQLPLIQGILTTPVVFWGGWPFLYRAALSIWQVKLNMFTLIGLGVSIGWAYSIVMLLLGDPQYHFYFEVSATITTLVLLGQLLEKKARSRTGEAIRRLIALSPKTASLVLADRTEKTIPLETIARGNLLRIRPGEKIPVDGIVVEGSSFVNEAMLTGEADPVEKTSGSKATAGTLNLEGTFILRAEKIGSETMLSHIIELVRKAQTTRPPIQKLADTVSSYFVPLVLIAAAITFCLWFWFGPDPAGDNALINSIGVLIIACPCALGLATPMSIMVGIGKGAEMGILIKDASALEKMAQVTILAVDKTGTLTEGAISLNEVAGDEPTVLQLAASLEQGSQHPLAKSVIALAKKKGIPLLPLTGFQSVGGKGAAGLVAEMAVMLGNRSMMASGNVPLTDWEQQADKFESQGQTVAFLAKGRQCLGMLAFSDRVKETTPSAIQSLKKDGVRIAMISGDNAKVAQIVGRQIGVDIIEAETMPESKYEIVKKFQLMREIVAMAGDGTNDAPALAQADVGIAMGTGTDVAIESSDISLVKGDLLGIVRARSLSKSVMRNIRENLVFAFAYNVLGIPVAAGVLYPFFGITLSPIIAAAAMIFSSLSVVLNALRLRKKKIEM